VQDERDRTQNSDFPWKGIMLTAVSLERLTYVGQAFQPDSGGKMPVKEFPGRRSGRRKPFGTLP
jgi:hypothetical protein